MAEYLLIERTELAHADVALLFGNQHAYEQLAKEGARLYSQGYCDKIVVSGGRKDNNGHVEAEVIEHYLLQQNIPPGDIITETLSTNTQENVLYSRDKIQDTYGPGGIQSLIAVGNIVAGRRFLMTLEQNWPEVFAMASNVNPFPFPVSEFGKNPHVANIVRKEFAKIIDYLQAGYIAEIPLEAINQTALQLPPPQPSGLS